ncbi:2'-5' RNA ligase family protein [Curtobacterium sp. VKM Ac-2922]|uniref:2'-5' RNA ligase family protein n=1 Tax=Curtobacterium sp. VKM Ac-2922 TaxID=2929475 RepID=UPI001FB355ED|nr:2'-5' RNA ligase family protein [Curtobacterium sp. VKM Ac-2922]MCJ1713607.1 2'-5' RNA ligase family protein [Curtobacterium sp. VKM Ac-2922]
MRSIELVLDDASDRAVRALWQALVAAELPSLGHAGTNDPHVTLVAGESVPVPGPLDEPLPTALRVAGVLLFPAGPGRHVFGLGVVVDESLARFHRAVHRGAPDAVDSSAPGRWAPHLTLARRIRDVDLGAGLRAITADAPLPEVLTVGGLRHWDGDTKVTTPLA